MKYPTDLAPMLSLCFLLVACAKYDVVRTSPHVPLSGMTIQVAPTDMSGAEMYDEPFDKWLAEMPPEKRRSWEGDLRAFESALDSALAEEAEGRWRFARGDGGGAEGLTLRVRVTEVDRFAARGFVRGTMSLVDGGGEVLDEIALDIEVGGSFSGEMTMRGAGTEFGERFVSYVEERSGR